ncbi:hypothetical protein PUMCH_002654 [Australozyma saopauloensis]|uniref:Uncharacterized protein n=1 Tax=Australozyma saopauloensis TaxID=291208 RepID=A0AAX4H9V3_9ASCO|nr:hypothetical protein PUMCH_002654 [[Candida] saopauloensis]
MTLLEVADTDMGSRRSEIPIPAFFLASRAYKPSNSGSLNTIALSTFALLVFVILESILLPLVPQALAMEKQLSLSKAGTAPAIADGPPPQFIEIPPQFLQPPAYAGQTFREIVFCDGLFGSDTKAFPSYDSYRLFKEYHSIFRSNDGFETAKADQNLARGLPLMVSKRSWSICGGDHKYLRLYEALPSPEARDRLYDKADDRKIADVRQKCYLRYTRFRMTMTDGTKVIFFYHNSLRILDFEFQGGRYRFSKTDNGYRTHFSYDLFLLHPQQPSLIDGMTNSEQIADSNPLLGSRTRYSFGMKPKGIKYQDLVSPYLMGKFQSCRSETFFSKTNKASTLMLFSPISGDTSTNTSVDLLSLQLTAAAIILKNHEYDMRSNNQAASNSATANANAATVLAISQG